MARRVTYSRLGSSGRLGNQLYEIASTIGFARRRNVDPVFPAWDYSEFFSLPPSWFDDEAVGEAIDIPGLTGLPGIQKFYAQQWAFVAGVVDEVREVLAPSPIAREMLAQHLRDTGQMDLDFAGSISLHVRRGDNMNPETHPVGTWPPVSMSYYRDALELLGFGPVLVFSDGYDWCVENLTEIVGDREATVVKPGPVRSPDYFPEQYAADAPHDWIDLQLQARCGLGAVIANSTYSLWGAALNPRPTTFPDRWVGFRCREAVPDERTICPPDWTCLPNPVDPVHLHPNG